MQTLNNSSAVDDVKVNESVRKRLPTRLTALAIAVSIVKIVPPIAVVAILNADLSQDCGADCAPGAGIGLLLGAFAIMVVLVVAAPVALKLLALAIRHAGLVLAASVVLSVFDLILVWVMISDIGQGPVSLDTVLLYGLIVLVGALQILVSIWAYGARTEVSSTGRLT